MTTERGRLGEVLPEAYRNRVETICVKDIYRGCSSRLINEADLWEEHVAVDDLYIPYRNLLLLTAAAAYAQMRGCTEVYAAFINSNHAKEIDCSAAFFDRLAEMLADFGTVRIKMPFRDLSKTEVAEDWTLARRTPWQEPSHAKLRRPSRVVPVPIVWSAWSASEF